MTRQGDPNLVWKKVVMEKVDIEVKPSLENVAVVGTGVIGRSWIQVFTRAGCRTRIYDPDPAQLDNALQLLDQDLSADREDGLITAAEVSTRRALITRHADLAGALAGAKYVQ